MALAVAIYTVKKGVQDEQKYGSWLGYGYDRPAGYKHYGHKG